MSLRTLLHVGSKTNTRLKSKWIDCVFVVINQKMTTLSETTVIMLSNKNSIGKNMINNLSYLLSNSSKPVIADKYHGISIDADM